MVLAPSFSPLISIQPLPLTIQTLPLPFSRQLPLSACYESPIWTSSQWHKQKVAEHSAQLEEDDPDMVLIAHCELCDIGVGPGHIEQELYLYGVYDHDVLCIVNGREHLIKREKIEAAGGHWFLCCGGCARSKRRNLPQEQCLFDHRHWTTNMLTKQEQEGDGQPLHPITPQDFPMVWRQKDAYLTKKLAPFGLPLSWIGSKLAHNLLPSSVPSISPERPRTLASAGMALTHSKETYTEKERTYDRYTYFAYSPSPDSDSQTCLSTGTA